MLVQREGIRGPVPKLTARLIRALTPRGATVVTHEWGRRSDDEDLWRKVRRGLEDVLSVRRAVRGAEFDIAVVNTSHDWRTILRDVAVGFVLRRWCRPVILQFHGSRTYRLGLPGSRGFKLATTLLLRMTDGVLVLSSEERRQLHRFSPTTQVFVVKNPYERALFPNRDVAESPSGAPTLLFVGRLRREKGALELIEAMPSVLARAACKLIVVGDGELQGVLYDRIRQLGLADAVTVAGYLEGEELLQAYASADVFVLPSWSEGFPTVLAEAMDAGLPIVTTRIRGAVDHLIEREHALFVEPRDVSGLASALVEVIRDPELRARMGSANRERVEIFDPDDVAGEYLKVLRAVVSRAA